LFKPVWAPRDLIDRGAAAVAAAASKPVARTVTTTIGSTLDRRERAAA